MDLIHKFLNLVAPWFTFFSLCLFLPPFYLFKFFLATLGSFFSENVSGKVVIITGASSGIGEHLAYEYGRRGARLALTARREKSLQEVADRAHDLGSPDVITIRADVSNVDDCQRLVEETVNHFGRLDHLVNNAGITSVCMFEGAPPDMTNFRAVMDTNFWGSVYTTRFAVPHLRNSKGKIVVLSSANSWLPEPRTSVYNASKAALAAFFDTLRIELGQDVTITIVTPGHIESEITRDKHLSKEGKMEVEQDMRDVQVSAIPVASVSECAQAIVNSACRGDRSLTQPSWYSATCLWKLFFPEVIEWGCRLFYLTSPGVPHQEAPSKKILDLTAGEKKVLYPSTIQAPEIKTD
ncbi:Short-chain dehydrogenase/reductase SDR - like 10 [Theobroma cacao]|uniref:Hydroxysteroid dehydrogenase 1 n=1 Tax=Theobroma cacao TaxID=3641 RepID=A0A061G670_THECC|nr:Hydroxysteroid dehydrogenase 1 [Theobroma cacao]WRX17258.1 Short-chain dehydrogenase/reductase SDR - like 10 [Theobroma cacao]